MFTSNIFCIFGPIHIVTTCKKSHLKVQNKHFILYIQKGTPPTEVIDKSNNCLHILRFVSPPGDDLQCTYFSWTEDSNGVQICFQSSLLPPSCTLCVWYILHPKCKGYPLFFSRKRLLESLILDSRQQHTQISVLRLNATWMIVLKQLWHFTIWTWTRMYSGIVSYVYCNVSTKVVSFML